jgi:hypothetical protein
MSIIKDPEFGNIFKTINFPPPLLFTYQGYPAYYRI